MGTPRRVGRDEEIKIFHEYGLHLPTRHIIVESIKSDNDSGETGVDSNMWGRLVRNLHILENEPLAQGKDPTITITMNNPGGDAYHMFGMFGRLKTSRLPDGTPCPIDIHAYGYLMSAATIIFQAPAFGLGKRRIHVDATMMLHYGSDGYVGHSKDFQRWAEESRRLNAKMDAIYLELIRRRQPKFSQKELEKMIGYDYFLNAEQVVDLGLADELIEDPLTNES